MHNKTMSIILHCDAGSLRALVWKVLAEKKTVRFRGGELRKH